MGSSTDLTQRLYSYYSIKRISSSKSPIYQALYKYGFSNFRFEILEYCTVENLIEREQHYLNLRLPEYNILQVAGSSFGFKHSDKTFELFRNRLISKDTRKLLSLAATGRTLGAEDKEKISKARRGIKLGDDTKKKYLDLSVI